ncbi:single-stranded-DNA-specific exonuclease RecJ [Sulfurimonas sp. HSL1-6]|uniref:single-stranded-DNA-specific exonuclease RecJ n=1 Tax=Thiomicrolovo immobilis TaxID=3131935 RepID=UPI0031F7EF5B
MPKAPDAPLLDKRALEALLRSRFASGFSKLSDIPDPAGLTDASKAAKRIADAIRKGERIALVGDYDVDGVTATAITTLFFRQIPYPLEVTIPNRFTDGYGVSERVLERIDADVVFTVDNGINAFAAAEVCKARGIDLIITDHHTPSEKLPDAYAVVDPKRADDHYAFPEICGAQVAWLLMALIKKELGLSIDMGQFLELLALAIIADVMPLMGINRAIVQAGLAQMERSARPFSVIVREALGKTKLGAEDIGFQIAPRINAAGRLEDASLALELLIAPDEKTAFRQFELLTQLNVMRKAIEAEATEEAIALVRPDDRVIVVAHEGWHEGVVGIVAARLVQRFEKPTIVLSIEEGRAKGSARSLGNVSIYDLIASQEGLLEKFGGHKMAAGLSLRAEDVDAFRAGINAEAATLDPEEFLPVEEIVGQLDTGSVDFELLEILERYEPYGEGNPRPRFLARDAEVVGIRYLGSDGDHSKVSLRLFRHERETYDLMAFRRKLERPESGRLTCSYTLARNEWGGRVSIQMMLERLYG